MAGVVHTTNSSYTEGVCRESSSSGQIAWAEGTLRWTGSYDNQWIMVANRPSILDL